MEYEDWHDSTHLPVNGSTHAVVTTTATRSGSSSLRRRYAILETECEDAQSTDSHHSRTFRKNGVVVSHRHNFDREPSPSQHVFSTFGQRDLLWTCHAVPCCDSFQLPCWFDVVDAPWSLGRSKRQLLDLADLCVALDVAFGQCV